jgi:hypothetical protein
LGRSAGLAHARTGFQKRYFAAGKTAVVDKLVAEGATGPAAGEKRLVPIEAFMADLTVPGFNPQQHGLPISAAFSNTHSSGSSIAKGLHQEQGGKASLDRHRVKLYASHTEHTRACL